jgi:hypothetical protein
MARVLLLNQLNRKIMELVVMNYAAASVTKYTNLPDEWETEQIEEYLFKTLNLREIDIYYMVGDSIPVGKEEYHAEEKPEDKMLAQWEELKGKNPDALLLFRCGDFYEAYLEDAIKMGKTLNLSVITKNSVEYSVFPYHALDIYLPKLIRAGHRVAICDQLK